MGLRLRKSVNLGYVFRVNFSKTGIGYSWGVPGARLTKTATGRNRATLSIPGTGISYVKESGDNRKRANASSRSAPSTKKLPQPSDSTNRRVPAETIENADVNSFIPTEYQDFLNFINRFNVLDKATNIYLLLIGLTIFSLVIYTPIGILLLVLTCLCICVRVAAYKKYRINAYYDLDEYGENRVELINLLVKILQDNEKIWQLNDLYNEDVKNRSGVSQSVNRTPVDIKESQPRFLRCNVPCYYAKLKNETIYILPEKLLIEKNMRFGALEWKDMKINLGAVTFVEDAAPSDAEIIGETWRYVNKNGTPDKRYKDNFKRYRCKYGVLTFTSEQGFNTVLYLSNKKKAEEFTSKLLTYVSKELKDNE